jgi:prepilin-type N-terminal cleavage/methylation domain-containing protein/prepilin-type processing-associated H-X9-DG protein
MTHRKGFTLIELLVVIAIIAILAAILFPVFAQAKLAAKKAADLSNVKQVVLASLMYTNDYDDLFPKAQNVAFSDTADTVPSAVQYFDIGSLYMPYIKSIQLFEDSQQGGNTAYPGETFNDLLGGNSQTTLDSPAQVVEMSDNAFIFNGNGGACPNDGVPLNSYRYPVQPQTTGNVIGESDLTWPVPTPPCISWNPITPVLGPLTQNGNYFTVVDVFNIQTGAFTYNWVVQPYAKTWDAYGNLTYTYGSPTTGSGSAPTNNLDTEDLKWSLIGQSLNQSIALGSASPTTATPYFNMWSNQCNYGYADGHVKSSTPNAVVNHASDNGPSWDPGNQASVTGF